MLLKYTNFESLINVTGGMFRTRSMTPKILLRHLER